MRGRGHPVNSRCRLGLARDRLDGCPGSGYATGDYARRPRAGCRAGPVRLRRGCGRRARLQVVQTVRLEQVPAERGRRRLAPVAAGRAQNQERRSSQSFADRRLLVVPSGSVTGVDTDARSAQGSGSERRTGPARHARLGRTCASRRAGSAFRSRQSGSASPGRCAVGVTLAVNGPGSSKAGGRHMHARAAIAVAGRRPSGDRPGDRGP
jgi:hypothetical protein